MATITIHLDERDAELVRKFAELEGVILSDFARTAILGKVEDSFDSRELREAVSQDAGERFSIDEVLRELD